MASMRRQVFPRPSTVRAVTATLGPLSGEPNGDRRSGATLACSGDEGHLALADAIRHHSPSVAAAAQNRELVAAPARTVPACVLRSIVH